MRPSPPGHTAAGFTLVEMLVVIAIISVLAGLVLASVTAARRFADNRAAAIEIQTLRQAIDNYNGAWGDYPPTSLAALKVKANTTNEGNESLVLCLSGRKKGGPFHEDFKESRLANSDLDTLSPKDLQTLRRDLEIPQTVAALFEYVDLWGNPFVYIHNRDYGKKLSYIDRQGGTVQVGAAKSAKLGSYQAPTAYQIWSFGPNGINENGEGDDIASWK